MKQINDNKQPLKGPGFLRNGKRYSNSKQGPPTKRRRTSRILPHPASQGPGFLRNGKRYSYSKQGPPTKQRGTSRILPHPASQGPGLLRNGKRYSDSKQGPPTKQRCTSRISPHPASKPDSRGIFSTTLPEIWAVICSTLSKNDCRNVAELTSKIGQTMHSQILHKGLLEFQTMSQCYQENLPYCEAWIFRLIAMKSIQDMEEGVHLHILSKKRAEQMRAILPNHYYLAESLVARLSDISDPIIFNNKLYVSSLIKNHMSQKQSRAIKSYFRKHNIQLVWQTDLNSPAMMPYFSNPMISYVAQNELLKRNPPIDMIGSYGPDGTITTILNSDRPGIREYYSLGYNGKLHVFLNTDTNDLIVSNINADGSRSISCPIHAPYHINDEINGKPLNLFEFKVAISPNNKWIIIYLTAPHRDLLYLFEYHQDQDNPSYLKYKPINIEKLGTENVIKKIQFTQDSKILLISAFNLTFPNHKLLMISTTSFNEGTDTKKDETDTVLFQYSIEAIGYDYILTRLLYPDLKKELEEIKLQKWDIKSIQSGTPSTQHTIQIPNSTIATSLSGSHYHHGCVCQKTVLTDEFLFVIRKHRFLDRAQEMIICAEVLVFKNEKSSDKKTYKYQHKSTHTGDLNARLHISDTGNTIISYSCKTEPLNLHVHVFNRDKAAYDPVDISLPLRFNMKHAIISSLDENFFIVMPVQLQDQATVAFTLIQNSDSTWRAVNHKSELNILSIMQDKKLFTNNGLNDLNGLMTKALILYSNKPYLFAHRFDFLYKGITRTTDS